MTLSADAAERWSSYSPLLSFPHGMLKRRTQPTFSVAKVSWSTA
jgi:hypothetical protein